MEALREKHYTIFISILLCNLKNIYLSLSKKPQVLVKSVGIIKPFTPEESFEILRQYEIKYDLQINPESKPKIVNLSGGHTVMLKSLFLTEVDKPNFIPDLNELLLDEGLLRWLQQFTSDLPKNIIGDVISNTRSIESQDILNKFGYINAEGVAFSPILEAYLHKIKHELQPKTPVLLKLSSQEKDVYDFLISNKNLVVSRDDIAKVIWGKHIWIITQIGQ